MTSRKLLQDLNAGFQEPRTERADRRTTSIPFYIRETSIENSGNCFCHGGIGSKRGHNMNWRVLRDSKIHRQRRFQELDFLLNNFFHGPKILVGEVGDRKYNSPWYVLLAHSACPGLRSDRGMQSTFWNLGQATQNSKSPCMSWSEGRPWHAKYFWEIGASNPKFKDSFHVLV